MITVKYFASLREKLGRDGDKLDDASLRTVEDVWRAATSGETTDRVLCAVNQEYARFDTPVSEGDEVAFFPPVTGG